MPRACWSSGQAGTRQSLRVPGSFCFLAALSMSKSDPRQHPLHLARLLRARSQLTLGRSWRVEMPTEGKPAHPGSYRAAPTGCPVRFIPKRPLDPEPLRAPRPRTVAGAPRPKRKFTFPKPQATGSEIPARLCSKTPEGSQGAAAVRDVLPPGSRSPDSESEPPGFQGLARERRRVCMSLSQNPSKRRPRKSCSQFPGRLFIGS